MAITVAQPTAGTFQIQGAYVVGTIVAGVFTQLVGGGNAVVPNGAAIQPPQSFVNMFVAQTTLGLSVANLHGLSIQSITMGAVQGWFNDLMEQEFAFNGEVFPDWSNNALDAASVNTIIAQVLGFAQEHVGFNGTLDISGGTNAAPTGQGLLDKASLILAGWTVTTN